MTLLRSWPPYVLLAAAVIYITFHGDEPANDEKVQHEKVVESFPQRQITSLPQAPAWNRQEGNQEPFTSPPITTYPGSEYTGIPSQPNRYRFRPQETNKGIARGYQPPYSFAEQSSIYPAAPNYEFRDSGAETTVPAPDGMNYRFRPLNEERQSRRWHGNYANRPHPSTQKPRTYPNGSYTTPENPPRSSVGINPLWANSMSEQ